jgi:hypothetical protein
MARKPQVRKYPAPGHAREKRKAYKRKRYAENKAVILAEPSRAKSRLKRTERLRGGGHRRYDLWKLYRITEIEWADMFAAQGCRCASCPSIEPFGNGYWHTDHDHVTGKVRGILCGPCNMTLGHAKDDPERLRSLADYVEKHRGRN